MKSCHSAWRPLVLAAQCAAFGVLGWTGLQAYAQSVGPPQARTGPTTSRPALQAPPAAAKVLLVDDDDSDNNSNPASGKLSASDTFYRKLLADQAYSFDTVVVPRYSDGPSLEKLKTYSLLLWYTGAAYGGNRDNTAVISLKDEQALTAYLQQAGGTVLLFSPGYLNNALGAGGAALWAKAESPFLQQVLGIQGGRGLLQRFKDGAVAATGGGTYAVTKSPSVETQFSAMNPDSAETLFTATLDPDGKGAQPVAVAVSHAVGSGRLVYVGFTFENITADANQAFGNLMVPSGKTVPSGQQIAGAEAVASQSETPFSPRRASTSALTVTGTGALTEGPPFVAKKADTLVLTVTGTGRLTDGTPFVAKQAGTATLTVTGTGSLR
jgi:hypothetical protein